MEKNKWELLNYLYKNPKSTVSFSSPHTIYKNAKLYNDKITINDVERYLQTTKTYTQHKQIIKNFKRRKTIVKGINDQWQLDLIDVSSIKKYNNSYRYILACIDCFSRKAYAELIKNKTAKETLNAFKKIIFKNGVKPRITQFDDGGEFKKEFRAFLIEQNIKYFSTSSDNKASIIERWNRTIQNKIYRYLTSKNSLRYSDTFQQLVKNYNNSIHRTLGISPNSVNKFNEKKLWKKQYKDYIYQKNAKFLFQINDKVKIVKYRKTFQKGYLSQWKEEIFTILFRLKTNPVTYILKDGDDEILHGSFYTEELNKVIIN